MGEWGKEASAKPSWEKLAIGALISAVYVSVWWQIIVPYRLIPTDDEYFIRNINNPDPIRHFFTFLLIQAERLLRGTFRPQDIYFLVVLTGNGFVLWLSYLLTLKFTGKFTLALGVALLFCCATWPAVYYYWGSYTPVKTALYLASLYFLVTANHSQWPIHLLLSGYWLCLALLTALGGAPLVIPIAALFFYRYRQEDRKTFWKKACLFGLPFLMTGLYFIKIRTNVIRALSDNLSTHKSQAESVFGYEPNSPFFTFFHILGVHDSIYLWCSLLMIIGYLLVKHKMNTTHHQLFLLFPCLLLIHILTINFLPFSGLGRTYYPSFPILLIGLAIGYHLLSIYLDRWVYRGLTLILALIIPWMLVQQLKLGRQMWQQKLGGALAIEKQFANYPLYVTREDIHATSIARWIHREVNIVDHPWQIPRQPPPILLRGPYGRGSGKSVIYSFCIQSDSQQARLPKGTQKTYEFPYHAYFPLFMMEEEVCQALYFQGRIPDYRKKTLQLHAFQLR